MYKMTQDERQLTTTLFDQTKDLMEIERITVRMSLV